MRKPLLIALLALTIVALAGVWYVVTAEGYRYATWNNAEEFHEASYSDGYTVGMLALAGMILVTWAVFSIIDRLKELPLAEEIKEPTPARTYCPLAVIEVVAVPIGQEQEVRKQNIDLFTLGEARRILNLLCTVSKGEVEQLERLLGIEALYRPGNAHLVRLGRRGFHGE